MAASWLALVGTLVVYHSLEAAATKIHEMYPLYWTPSKEGTFCVIRLNLS